MVQQSNGEFTALVGVEYKAAEFTAPKEGVRVLTGLKSNNDKLVWSAQTAIALEGDQWGAICWRSCFYK